MHLWVLLRAASPLGDRMGSQPASHLHSSKLLEIATAVLRQARKCQRWTKIGVNVIQEFNGTPRATQIPQVLTKGHVEPWLVQKAYTDV